MGAVLIKQKEEKGKMNEWPSKWGPALVKRKKKEKETPNGGSAHQAKERRKRKKNELAPKTGAVVWVIETLGASLSLSFVVTIIVCV